MSLINRFIIEEESDNEETVRYEYIVKPYYIECYGYYELKKYTKNFDNIKDAEKLYNKYINDETYNIPFIELIQVINGKQKIIKENEKKCNTDNTDNDDDNDDNDVCPICDKSFDVCNCFECSCGNFLQANDKGIFVGICPECNFEY